MGLGPPRENDKPEEPLKPLSPDVTNRLGEVLVRLDEVDPVFKQNRDEEREAQLAKIWNRACKKIDGHLRSLAKVLINSHQLNLDMGSDGGGRGTKPWIEETSMKFDRLYFRLEDDHVVATFGDSHQVARCTIDDVDYDWMEHAVVQWVIESARLAATV